MKDSVEQDYFNSLKSRSTLSRITIAPAIDSFDSDNKKMLIQLVADNSGDFKLS